MRNNVARIQENVCNESPYRQGADGLRPLEHVGYSTAVDLVESQVWLGELIQSNLRLSLSLCLTLSLSSGSSVAFQVAIDNHRDYSLNFDTVDGFWCCILREFYLQFPFKVPYLVLSCPSLV